MSRAVRVQAGSRLHFGMFSFGQPNVRAFGGVGAMISEPALCITVRPASTFDVTGPLAERAEQWAYQLFEYWSFREPPPCEICVEHLQRGHTGLGAGTQLALSVAVGLAHFLDRNSPDPLELAAVVGRARRSAVGTHGFVRGGLIVEAGKPASDSHVVSPLASRVALQEDWRFVLASPVDVEGLHGEAETKAFAQLPPVPVETTRRLCQLALLELVPAAREGRFEEFSRALYEYGVLAGECFSTCQGGTYAGAEVADLVETIRDLGIHGVGQSSWGPTVFALVCSAAQGQDLIDRLRGNAELGKLQWALAAPLNHSARVEDLSGTADEQG